jgi:N-acetylglutamate synthase-like GNAT family acetyltransferase
MPKINLRPANKVDRRRIIKLVWEAHLNPTGLKWQRFVVAFNPGGKVIGCAQLKPHQDGSCELASLVVDPDYRGQGISRLMVDYLIRGADRDLFLMCRASLGDFYRQFGFDSIAESEMPPFFRRISRLASFAKRLRKEGEALLVMRRQPVVC